MSLSTYSGLLSAVDSWLARTDLSSYTPDFVTLFEAEAARRLRVRPRETSTTLSPSSGSVSLPSDYLGWRSVTSNTSPPRTLQYANPDWLRSEYPNSDSGLPVYFTIEASALRVRPVDDSTISFLYFAKDSALSSALNWLFTNHPDAYLYGTLTEAYLFDKDEQRASVWKARRDAVFENIELLAFREPSGMAIRVVGPTP